jgi:hypothetical protein
MVSSWVLLCAASLVGQKNAAKEDARLLAAVEAAGKNGLAPGKVEAAVGRRATLNTFREEDDGPFHRADIAPDRKRNPSLPGRKGIRWAAYWVRPVEARNPRIVGIVWPKKGKPRIFYGEVLPPG